MAASPSSGRAGPAFEQLDRPDETTPYMVQEALDVFEFDLQRLLDGLDAYITAAARRRKGSGRNATQKRQ